MQEKDAVIGGEGNGGVICPDLHYGRDALAGIAIVLQHLTENGMSSSEYRSSLPNYFMSKNKIQLDDLGKDADEVLETVKEHFSSLEPNTVDGVKIDFAEGWVHLIKSNTEPIIRIYSEGRSPEAAEGFANKIFDLLK
jgi:phosphomannomutase